MRASGRTPADRAFAELARKSGKPTVLIANKMEGTAGEAGRLDAYALGLGDPVAISAEHNEGLSDLYDALRAALPAQTAAAALEAAEPSGPHPIRVAIVGRPNAGKSTLVNRLIGEDRLLTAPEAGTTRDAIAVDLDWHGQKFRIHDTAGIRRRARVDEKLEKLSVADALNAVRFAEVVVVLLDVGNAFEEQDQRIADLVEQEGRAIVIAVNKWDLKEKTAGAIGKLREQADEKLMQMKGVPLVAVSAITGEGLDRLMQAIVDAFAIWNKRVPTSALNRWFEHAVEFASAAGGVGAKIAPQLRHASEIATAEFRRVLHPRRCGARCLQALSGELAARELRASRHADPPDPAGKGQPVQRAGEAKALRREYINGEPNAAFDARPDVRYWGNIGQRSIFVGQAAR